MPFHSLVVTNLSGSVLFSKYYCGSYKETSPRNIEYEHQLLKYSASLWQGAESKRSISVDKNIFVVFQKCGELMIFLAGFDEIDEPILTDVLALIIMLMTDQLDGRRTESSFLNSETYGKFQVILEEVMPNGILETIDVDVISKMSKLKNVG